MKKNIFVALFAVVCVALVMVSVTLVNCHRANVMLRKTVISQANEILELKGSYNSRGNYNVRRSQKVAKTERSFRSSLLLTKLLEKYG